MPFAAIFNKFAIVFRKLSSHKLSKFLVSVVKYNLFVVQTLSFAFFSIYKIDIRGNYLTSTTFKTYHSSFQKKISHSFSD